jgi:SAM-dependent methyltransferase
MNIPEVRSVERLRYHFEVERELADRLLRSSREARISGLYTELYNQLFRLVPDHPQLQRKEHRSRDDVEAQLARLSGYLRSEARYLEIGAGDCTLTFRVAERVSEAIAVDVSNVISSHTRHPANFRLVISDGVHLPLDDGTIDVAYSNQLMEHLHPEDAFDQLLEIRRVLKPGGIYIFRTPNRLTGPHDISGQFSDVACGFHLKEYLHKELRPLLSKAGFRATRVMLGFGRTRGVELPVGPFIMAENLLERAPPALRRSARRSRLVNKLLGISIIAHA